MVAAELSRNGKVHDYMKAVVIEHYGGPDVVQLREIAIPQPGPFEVLIKVAAAGINFMDIHTRQGKYEQSKTYPVALPCVLGMEGAGIVVQVGKGVRHAEVGDRVAWCIAWGSYAEYISVPEHRIAKVPQEISLELAAASLFQGSTAHYLAHDVARLTQGNTCLIHAASGSIGQILVQMAKRLGVTVIAATSTWEKAAIARALGADHTLLYENFVERIMDLTEGKGVDVAFDPLGRETLRRTFCATRKFGLVINYGSVSGSVKDLDPIELGEAGSLFLTRPRLADYLAAPGVLRYRAEQVFAALLDGTLQIDVAQRYCMSNILEAHERLEHRRQIGKAVLTINQDS